MKDSNLLLIVGGIAALFVLPKLTGVNLLGSLFGGGSGGNQAEQDKKIDQLFALIGKLQATTPTAGNLTPANNPSIPWVPAGVSTSAMAPGYYQMTDYSYLDVTNTPVTWDIGNNGGLTPLAQSQLYFDPTLKSYVTPQYAQAVTPVEGW